MKAGDDTLECTVSPPTFCMHLLMKSIRNLAELPL